MIYKGKNLNHLRCTAFLKDECEIQRYEDKDVLEITIILRETGDEIAHIISFFYGYDNFNSNRNKAMHIKRLGVIEQYSRKGIATYLMQEAILYAEKMRVKHITVNPSAATFVISQEDLEKFYSNFRFSCFLKREKQIEFKVVID